jgi:dTDP-4-amino-4,6-dideoxygalactose transaminase
MSNRIPFNRADLCGDELLYIRQAIEAGHISGNGPFCLKCEDLLKEVLGAPAVLLSNSCTSALEMSAILLGLKAGDDFIVPSFTFVSTAESFVRQGARPVFADVRADTLNIDESKLESLVTPRTKAIVVVHYAGVACEMDSILAISDRTGIPIVEDTAHGLFGTYHGRSLGTLGTLGTLSFHETKNITCGEGGALIVNDGSLLDRALVVRDKGTDRSRFSRGEVPRYTWVDHGSSFVLSDMLAAFLLAQLEKRDMIQNRRKRVWDHYLAGLSGWATTNGVQLPFIPAGCESAWHLFHMIMPDRASRDSLLAMLADHGILSVFHYQPLHLSAMGSSFGGRPGDCPVTESVSERLIRLPFFRSMTDSEQEDIIDTVLSFRS